MHLSMADAIQAWDEEQRTGEKGTFLNVLIIIVDGIRVSDPRHVGRKIIKMRE